MTSLDNFGLNLEKDFSGSDDIVQDRMEKNLAFQMRRVKVKNMAKPFIFQQNMSRIVLPEAIFTEVYIYLMLSNKNVYATNWSW